MKKSIFSMALMAMTIAFVGCKSDEPSNGSQDGDNYQLDSIISYTIDGTKTYKEILDYNYGNDQLIVTRYYYTWENNQWIKDRRSVITCTGKITNMTQGCYNFLSYYPDELKETIGWSKVSSIRYVSDYDGDWYKEDDDEDTYTIDANGFLTEINYQSYPSDLVDSKRKEVFTSNSQGQPISSEYYKFEGDWKIWFKAKFTYNNDGKLTMIMEAVWDYEKKDLGEFRKSIEISYNGNQIELISIDNLWEKSGKYMYTYDGYGNISTCKRYYGSDQQEGVWDFGGTDEYYYSKVK